MQPQPREYRHTTVPAPTNESHSLDMSTHGLQFIANAFIGMGQVQLEELDGGESGRDGELTSSQAHLLFVLPGIALGV